MPKVLRLDKDDLLPYAAEQAGLEAGKFFPGCF
jgi:hypothetical protein